MWPYNSNSDKTVTNLDLTTKDNVTRDSFQEHTTFRLYCGFIRERYKQNDDITHVNRILQEYEVNAGITLDAAASGGHWGRVGYWGKRGGKGSSVALIGHGRGRV